MPISWWRKDEEGRAPAHQPEPEKSLEECAREELKRVRRTHRISLFAFGLAVYEAVIATAQQVQQML
ncbi:hypothetical protein PV341_07790 [Streptomyces sp. PA03-1a]|nr:hypothetical protein [Streptomyces sp. PA03-1a]